MSETVHQVSRMYFVPKDKIKHALCDFDQVWNGGFTWVKHCDYLKDDNSFAVLIIFSDRYPWLENEFKKWERKTNDKYDSYVESDSSPDSKI